MLTDRHKIIEILQNNNIYAKKNLGQNFLTDESALQTIIDSANIKSTDNIIEIGPGLGTLTEQLAQKCKKVIAIEKDTEIIPILKKNTAQFQNIEIINQDALEYQSDLKNFKIVANIPYYITSPLINHFLLKAFIDKKVIPETIVLLTQKEVAEKICAPTGKLNVLALNIQSFADTEIMQIVPKTSFFPSPKVNSAIIRIMPHQTAKISCNLKIYFRIIKAAFSQKRKKLHNSLTHNLHLKNEDILKILQETQIDSNLRAEHLSIEDWEKLSIEIEKYI